MKPSRFRREFGGEKEHRQAWTSENPEPWGAPSKSRVKSRGISKDDVGRQIDDKSAFMRGGGATTRVGVQHRDAEVTRKNQSKSQKPWLEYPLDGWNDV
jgi:hypothetical protein